MVFQWPLHLPVTLKLIVEIYINFYCDAFSACTASNTIYDTVRENGLTDPSFITDTLDYGECRRESSSNC